MWYFSFFFLFNEFTDIYAFLSYILFLNLIASRISSFIQGSVLCLTLTTLNGAASKNIHLKKHALSTSLHCNTADHFFFIQAVIKCSFDIPFQ